MLILAVPVLLVCVLFGLRETFLAYGHWMISVGRRILGIDVKVTGLERLDAATPYVFMSNHLSFLDGPLLMTILDRPARLIREKRYSFLIYPEGTRSWDGNLQPFRRGGFFLAVECGAPIVPVTIRGTFELMPHGKRLVRKGPVQITFHEPVPVTGCTRETMAELIEKVKGAVSSAL